LPVKSEKIAIGNTGFQQYYYDVSWKGDTVTGINAHDNEESGYSHINKTKVKVFSRNLGPGKLYQREHLLANNITPVLSDILEDKKIIYF
jgi:hypothetical protein